MEEDCEEADYYYEVRESRIHGQGIYAGTDIPANTELMEYVGERIDKKEGERRSWAQVEEAEKTGEAAVYIFTVDDEWDLDGNIPKNDARLINHSCDPNCEAWTTEEGQIFIGTLQDVKADEELSFDYGFDVDSYEDHPCRCGSEKCKGYIVSQEQWPELEKRLAKKKGK